MMFLFSPPIAYDATMDLWGDVYQNFTSLRFDIHAIDNGTIPLGTSASINITVSNTCVMDVLYGDIKYMFTVDNTTGMMFLRIPGYWNVNFRKFFMQVCHNYPFCVHMIMPPPTLPINGVDI